MTMQANRRVQRWFGRRKLGAYGAMFVLLLPLAALAGCSDDVQNTFNAAAVNSIETGLKAIADGLISGLAAVANSQIEANGGSTENSGSSGNGATTTTGSTSG